MPQNKPPDDTAKQAKALALVRIGVGAAGFLTPRLFARTWLGRAGSHPSVVPAVRGLAARDAALGLGALFAIRRGRPVRGWLEAGALADAADSVSSLFARADVPRGRRLFFTASGAAVSILGMRLARRISPT